MKANSNDLLKSLGAPGGLCSWGGSQRFGKRAIQEIPAGNCPTGFRKSFRVPLEGICSRTTIPVEPEMLLKQYDFGN